MGFFRDRGLEGVRLERVSAVDRVGDIELSRGLVARGRDQDDALRRGQRHEARLGSPPVVTPVVNLLMGSRADQLVGAGADRPALGEIEVGECLRILTLPDVGRHHDLVVLAAERKVQVEEARVGLVQLSTAVRSSGVSTPFSHSL